MSRLAGTVGAFLAVAAVWAAPASANEASISVAPSSGQCGSIVQVTGSGFPPNLDIYVTVTRGGGHHIDPVPTTRSDGAGNFSTSVRVETGGCPSPFGMVAAACPVNSVPVCDPKASAPFTIIEDGLPTAGIGPAQDDALFSQTTASLLAIGATCLAFGAALRAWHRPRTPRD